MYIVVQMYALCILQGYTSIPWLLPMEKIKKTGKNLKGGVGKRKKREKREERKREKGNYPYFVSLFHIGTLMTAKNRELFQNKLRGGGGFF